MVCKNCGAELEDSASFCEKCGSAKEENAKSNASNKKVLVYIELAIAVVCIGTFGISLVLMKKNATELSQKTKNDLVPVYDVVTQEQVDNAKVVLESNKKKLSDLDADIKGAEETNAELSAELTKYENIKSMSDANPETVINNLLYEKQIENAKCIITAKGIVINSFGYDISGDDYSDTSAEDFEEELKGELLDKYVGQFGFGDASGIIKSGIGGAINSDGNIIEGTIEGLKSGINDEISAKISDLPKKFMGETVSKMVDTVEFVFEDDGRMSASDVAYLESKISSEQICEDLTELEGYIDADVMSADDFSRMIYLYRKYGTDVDNMNEVAGKTVIDFDWKNDYEKLEEVYTLYEKNLSIIKMLSPKETDNPENVEEEGTSNE